MRQSTQFANSCTNPPLHLDSTCTVAHSREHRTGWSFALCLTGPPADPRLSPLCAPARYVRRDLWRNKAIEIRVQFERNRHVKDPRAVAALLNEAEKEVQRMAHPDPYRRESSMTMLEEVQERKEDGAGKRCVEVHVADALGPFSTTLSITLP